MPRSLQLQREQTLVYELGPDETLVPSNASQVGSANSASTTMVVMEAPSLGPAIAHSGMEVRHIFLPSQEDPLHRQQLQSHHTPVQASLPPPSEQEEHVHPQHQSLQQIQHDQQDGNSESQPESEIKLSSEIIDSLQHHHQYHNRQEHQQQHHQDNYGPTVIKLTPEDIVSLQQHHNSIDPSQHHQLSHHISTTGQEDSKSIEISLPSGTTHMLALPSGLVEGQVMPGAGDGGEETTTVQYHVECLSGDTLTEADYNAIRMLAQASLAGGSQHLTQ